MKVICFDVVFDAGYFYKNFIGNEIVIKKEILKKSGKYYQN